MDSKKENLKKQILGKNLKKNIKFDRKKETIQNWLEILWFLEQLQNDPQWIIPNQDCDDGLSLETDLFV